MNKLAITSILGATILVAGIFALMPVQKASTNGDEGAAGGKKHDFALLATSDASVTCASQKPMTVFIAMTNKGSDAGDVRVQFLNPDFTTVNDQVDFAIGSGQTISMTQAAHNTQSGSQPIADAGIKVLKANGADLQGWISVETLGKAPFDNPPFGPSFCITTP